MSPPHVSTDRRCGITSIGGALGCCRPEYHAGPCCAHDSGTLTNRPGHLSRPGPGPLAPSISSCNGAAHPVQSVIRIVDRPAEATGLYLPEGNAR